jgi:hypothetical protein
VVLKESGELALIVEPGLEVPAHRLRVPLTQAIVEPLVVGVIESLLEHPDIVRSLGKRAT